MNIDVNGLFDALNRRGVEYILIGGMNFTLRHEPVLTFDVDIWIRDTTENLNRCEGALADIDASWGPDEQDWLPVKQRSPGWLSRQSVFAMTSRCGPVDVFRSVAGLTDWLACKQRAQLRQTAEGVSYLGLSDEDMLACQYALGESQRKLDRINYLERLHSNE